MNKFIQFSKPSATVGLLSWMLLFNLSGCGGGAGDQPQIAPVKGTITLDNQPLVGAEVMFTPQTGRPAKGVTDDSGNYELIYVRDAKGSQLGLNTVSISMVIADDGQNEGDDFDQSTLISPEIVIPSRYNTETELSADVKELDENVFDFQLTSEKIR